MRVNKWKEGARAGRAKDLLGMREARCIPQWSSRNEQEEAEDNDGADDDDNHDDNNDDHDDDTTTTTILLLLLCCHFHFHSCYFH